MDKGHVVWSDEDADDDATERATYQPDASQGITAFRWAKSIDEVHGVLGNERADELGAVPVLNSWGTTTRSGSGCRTTSSIG